MWNILLVSIVFLLSTTSVLYAGPAFDGYLDVQQPDGTAFKVRKHGDEFQNWTETESGHTVIRNKDSHECEYAEQNPDGTLRGSGQKVIPHQNAPANIRKKLKPPRNKEAEKSHSQSLQKIYQQRTSAESSISTNQSSATASFAPGDWTPLPISGSRKVIVILVNFTDRSLITNASGWSDSIFSTAAGFKSVANYYKDNSFNTLSVVPVSHTQPGGPAGVVTVSVPYLHPDNGTAEKTWVAAAINAAGKYVNFASLDTNNNGYIDRTEAVVYLIPAGYEESGSSKVPSVWAHSTPYTSGGLLAAGKRFPVYAMNGELNNSGVQHPMGVIAHEMGHQFCGLPDLYDTSDINQGMGYFSIMAGGSWGSDTGENSGTTPTNLDAWSREYLGWTTPVSPTSSSTLTLAHPLSSQNAAYKLIAPLVSTSEYFLVENRQPVGWDQGVRGKSGFGSAWAGGLLITHIDITAGTDGSNDINDYTANSGRQGVIPVQASTVSCDMLSSGATCWGKGTTLFYQGNNSNWGPSTVPNSNYYSGAGTSQELKGISLPASTMTAAFGMSAPTNGACGSSNTLAFSVAPSTNLCSVGTPSAVSGSGTWSWTCSGVNGGASASCTANYAIQAWSVTATTDGNGTVTCTSPVDDGATASCVVTAASGYQLANFTDNNVDKLVYVTGGSYSIANVTGNHTIAATFSQLPYSADNGSCGSSNGGTFSLAPTTNLCATGTASTVTGNGLWIWNCVGTNNGITASCSASIAAADAIPVALLPQTGQTVCYDAAGTTVTCTGGQDGELQTGLAWPTPRFVDNGDKTQTDKLTGLIWSKDANPAAATKTWQQALDYIKTLNSQNYLGHNDWRLPNINELASLVNKGQSNTSTWLNGQGFLNVQSSYYWSSSSGSIGTNYAWYVDVNSGFVGNINRSLNFYVWPVRTGQSGLFGNLTLPRTGQTTCYSDSGATISCSGTGQDGELQTGIAWSTPRFIDNGDQTQTDKLTGLIWSKNANPAAGTKTWQQALDYIKSLNSQNYLGHNDWRLPNINELESLGNKGQTNTSTWLNGLGFLNIQSNFYWSSSSYSAGTSFAWLVSMFNGSEGIYTKSDFSYVWPVRAEQYWPFDSLLISVSPKFGITPVGTSTNSRQLSIGNRGSSTQSVTSISITGANASDFTITTGGSAPCVSLIPTLAAGASCTLIFDFSPASNGTKSASLDITTNGTTNSIPLSGTAISTIYGVVTDQSTGLPVSGATVTLNTTATATTGIDGSYTFGDLPAATYSISISKTSYQTISKSGLVTTTTSSANADILLPTIGPLNITSATLQSATVGEDYSSRVMVVGGTGPYTFNKVTGSLPTGLSLDTLNGAITGTPSGSGSYTFAIGVTDAAAGYSEKEYTIDLVQMLRITTSVLPRGTNSASYIATISVIGGKPGYTYKVTNGEYRYFMGATWEPLYLNETSGAISGTLASAIDRTFTVTVTDATSRSTSQQLSIGVDEPLSITTTQIPTGTTTNSYTATLTATGGYGAYVWTITSGSLPTGISLNRFTGIISGQTSSTGSFPLGITVQDAAGRTASKSFTLKTSAPLAITTSTFSAGYVGTSYAQNILTSGGIAPLSFSFVGALPTGLTLDAATGAISGIATAAGLTNLSVSVTDSAYPTPVTVTQSISLRVWNALNITTTTIPGGTQKAAYSTTLSGTGGAQPLSWSIATGSLPQGITIDGASGVIAGTPATCGTFPITTRLTDSAATPKSVDKALTLAVACSNDYIISGNAGVAGATVTYSGTTSGSVTADGSGSYSIGPLMNGTYTVTPSKPQYLFTPASKTVSVDIDTSVAAFTAVQDVTGPLLAVSTLANNAITNTATLNISGNVTDTSGVANLKINGTDVTVTNGSFSHALTLQVGANTISIIATDTLGNSTTEIRTITLDTTAPVLTVSAPADNSKTAQPLATITGIISETSTVTVTLNTGTPQNASITGNSFSTAITLASGLNSITVKATDLAGNTSSTVRTVTYDNSNPSLAITSPIQDVTINQNSITINGTVSDTQTAATVSLSFNNQTYTPTVTDGTFSQKLTIPSEGTFAITVKATDEAGNSSSVTRNVIYAALVNGACGTSNGIAVNTIPTENLCTIGTASAVSGSGPWGWTCAGSNSGIEATCSSDIQTYTITTTVTGGNGTVNCTSPVIYNTNSVCTITAAGGFQLATFADNTIDKVSLLIGGSYTINNVTANHIVVATFTDSQKPAVSAFIIPASATTLSVAISTFTATDNAAVTGYLLTETATAPISTDTGWNTSKPTSYTFSNIPVGVATQKTLYAWVKDAVGNVSTSATASTTITLPDVTAPTITTFTIPTSAQLTVPVTTFAATDNVAVSGYCITETNSSAGCSWSATAPKIYTFTTAGNKTLYAWVKDSTGNISLPLSAILNVSSKAGDCDANGSVTIAEVQSAINMFLGLKAVEVCVDQDSSSGVSIAEVQKVINSFLGL